MNCRGADEKCGLHSGCLYPDLCLLHFEKQFVKLVLILERQNQALLKLGWGKRSTNLA